LPVLPAFSGVAAEPKDSQACCGKRILDRRPKDSNSMKLAADESFKFRQGFVCRIF
jgi:hypothetical protein